MTQSSREIYWSAILADFRRSGLTHVEFCFAGSVLLRCVRPSVRRGKVLIFSGCNSHPATGSLQPVAIGAAVEPFVPPSAAPSRPVNFGLGDLVLIARCLYSAVW
jgi:hypothetical protein